MKAKDGPNLPGRAPRLHEQIVTMMAREIRSGSFPGGTHLTEEAVAERFGVSRGPVRNAFRQLEDAGLLVRSGGRGFAVADDVPTSPGASELERVSSQALATAASWEGIYHEVAKVAVVHAAYGSWRVVETEMAETFGVSRTVAREVLARLEQRGILRKEARTRWHLPEIDGERVADLYEMRSILEPVALEQAATRAPKDLLLEMRNELREADAIADLPASEFDRLERRLHVDLLSYAQNELLKDALHNCHALLFTNASLYRATRSRFGRDPFPGEHLEILDRVIEDRMPAAQEMVREHMRISCVRAVDRLSYMRAYVRLEPVAYLHPLPVE